MLPSLNDFKGMAQRQVQRHGLSATYTVQSQGVYDPATSSVSAGTTSTYTFKAFPSKASYSESQQPNLVGVDLRAFLIAYADLNVKPEVNSKITVGTDNFTILSVMQHYAHGEVVLWRILCKEG